MTRVPQLPEPPVKAIEYEHWTNWLDKDWIDHSTDHDWGKRHYGDDPACVVLGALFETDP